MDSGQSLGASASFEGGLGDIDGDGDLDAFFANFIGEASRIYTNDGFGIFFDSGQTLRSVDSSLGIRLGDMEGDGDLDAFLANSAGEANRVLQNNGSGIYIDSGQALGVAQSIGVSVGGLDGDADLDLLFANISGNRVYVNNGSGAYAADQSLGSAFSFDVTVADIEGDGDLEAIFGNGVFQANGIWLNQCLVDIALSKSALSNNVTVGQQVIYTLAVTNVGSEMALGIVVADSLPAEVTYVASSSSECIFTNGDIVCELGVPTSYRGHRSPLRSR